MSWPRKRFLVATVLGDIRVSQVTSCLGPWRATFPLGPTLYLGCLPPPHPPPPPPPPPTPPTTFPLIFRFFPHARGPRSVASQHSHPLNATYNCPQHWSVSALRVYIQRHPLSHWCTRWRSMPPRNTESPSTTISCTVPNN